MPNDDEIQAGAGVAVGSAITGSAETGEVNYFFPVTVEVRVTQADTGEIAGQVLDQLTQGLDSE